MSKSKRISKMTVLGMSLLLLGLAGPQEPSVSISGDGIRFPDGSFLGSAVGLYAGDNVVIVAKQGGHFTTILEAVDSITDASHENRYLIWVGPGTYEEDVLLKYYVDLQGADPDLVTIKGFVSGRYEPAIPRTHSELRSVTIEHTGGGPGAWLLVAMRDVNVRVSGPASRSRGVVGVTSLTRVSVHVTGSDQDVGVEAGYLRGVVLKTVDIAADVALGLPNAWGKVEDSHLRGRVSCGEGSLSMRNVVVTGDTVVSGVGPTTHLSATNSELLGSVDLSYAATAQLAHSRVGAATGEIAAFTCVGAYDNNLEPLDRNCQPIPAE